MRSIALLTKISVSLRLFENEGRSGRHRFKKWPIPSSLGNAIAVRSGQKALQMKRYSQRYSVLAGGV